MSVAIRLNTKDQIAKILMDHSDGLSENAVIQMVDTTKNAKIIQGCLDEMKSFGDVTEKHNHLFITAVGRSNYSDLVADDAPLHQPKPNSSIEPYHGFKTTDGKIFDSQAEAEIHQYSLSLAPLVDAYFERHNIRRTRQNSIRGDLIKWTLFYIEQT